ncbi:50S ribosomal protein L2 [Candidatus Berkelbacteria bacterium]|nr:50S ribosomal protein L2 [Candidatus Berkelbacteria bacterium]
MAIVHRRPTTPGQRQYSVNKRPELAKKRPEKALTETLLRHAGRDRFGRISIRHRGGGNRRKYRIISTLEQGTGPRATILAFEYDPNRSAHIALVQYDNGTKAYILAAREMTVGQVLEWGSNAALEPGNRLPLANIPRGFTIYEIALDPHRKGQLVRTAGASAVLVSHEDDGRYAQVRLPSGEVRRILTSAYASLGTVSNPDHASVSIGKAGRKRHMGWRPTVRGSAMNPNDHPHGGGEGKAPIGMPGPKTPWGKPALGKKTRRNKRTNVFIVHNRHEKRR